MIFGLLICLITPFKLWRRIHLLTTKISWLFEEKFALETYIVSKMHSLTG